MTLSDTIGHLARLFNSLADQRHFCHDHFLNLNAEYFHKHHILKIDMFIIEPMFSKVKVSFFCVQFAPRCLDKKSESTPVVNRLEEQKVTKLSGCRLNYVLCHILLVRTGIKK